MSNLNIKCTERQEILVNLYIKEYFKTQQLSAQNTIFEYNS